MSFSAYSNTSRPRLSPTYTLHLILLFLSCFSLQVSAWFIVTEPNKSTVWANGRTNVLRWNKGLLDGVHGFDVELSRMSRDGLTLVARNVPTHKTFALNIHLTDVPPGDDYVVLLINATHGHMHAVSQRFSILDAPPSPSTDSTSILGDGKEMGEEAVEGSKTVSVSGAPDPTRGWAETFAPVSGAVRVGLGMGSVGGMWRVAMGVLVGSVAVGMGVVLV